MSSAYFDLFVTVYAILELEASLGSPSKTSDDTCKPKKDNLKNSGKLRTQIKVK